MQSELYQIRHLQRHQHPGLSGADLALLLRGGRPQLLPALALVGGAEVAELAAGAVHAAVLEEEGAGLALAVRMARGAHGRHLPRVDRFRDRRTQGQGEGRGRVERRRGLGERRAGQALRLRVRGAASLRAGPVLKMESSCQQCRDVHGAVGSTRRTAHARRCRQRRGHRRRPRRRHDALQARRGTHRRRRQAGGAQEKAGGRPGGAARDAPCTHERLRHRARGHHRHRAARRRRRLLLLLLLLALALPLLLLLPLLPLQLLLVGP
mmetsp:Transcript_103787/g.332581  ORF Transcript_103787/g.332581 Transcript_103787/m.332581 type:complete len:266 (+) Transcript_103787:283-1080(+)